MVFFLDVLNLDVNIYLIQRVAYHFSQYGSIQQRLSFKGHDNCYTDYLTANPLNGRVRKSIVQKFRAFLIKLKLITMINFFFMNISVCQ